MLWLSSTATSIGFSLKGLGGLADSEDSEESDLFFILICYCKFNAGHEILGDAKAGDVWEKRGDKF